MTVRTERNSCGPRPPKGYKRCENLGKGLDHPSQSLVEDAIHDGCYRFHVDSASQNLANAGSCYAVVVRRPFFGLSTFTDRF